jgi:hypothetical protein
MVVSIEKTGKNKKTGKNNFFPTVFLFFPVFLVLLNSSNVSY